MKTVFIGFCLAAYYYAPPTEENITYRFSRMSVVVESNTGARWNVDLGERCPQIGEIINVTVPHAHEPYTFTGTVVDYRFELDTDNGES